MGFLLRELKNFFGEYKQCTIEDLRDPTTAKKHVRKVFKEFNNGTISAEKAHTTLEMILCTDWRPEERTLEDAHVSSPGSPCDAVELVNSYTPMIAYASQHVTPRTIMYDLGSGVGHTLLSLAILHPECKCIGVERLKACAEHSRKQAKRLQIPNIEIVHSSADDILFEQNAFFYLYHPFDGKTLRTVFEKMRKGKGKVCFVTPTIFNFKIPKHLYDEYTKKDYVRLPGRIYGEDNIHLLEAV